MGSFSFQSGGHTINETGHANTSLHSVSIKWSTGVTEYE